MVVRAVTRVTAKDLVPHGIGGPKPSGYNDKISKDSSQYSDQTEDKKETLPLRMNFSGMVDRDPCDLALHKYDSHTEAVSCIRDHRCASRVRLPHPPRPFSFPSL
jgi:hypothetical protein